jgi:Bacterial archaeo-eukaryotic release factor family 2
VDAGSLRELVRHRGPFASVYLDFSHDTEDAAAQLELRRRSVRSALQERGADEDTLATVDAAIANHEPAVGKAGLALVGAGGELLVDELLPMPPPLPVARYSELPYLLPLAEFTEPAVPHIVVVVDRIGAHFLAVDEHGRVVTEEQVEGKDHPVHKVRGGGWSHLSIQRHVEETVKQNLDTVAAETARLARAIGARAVIVAGEVQARSGLLAALPHPARDVAVEVEAGSRAPGADEHALRREVDRVIDEVRETDRRSLLATYRAESGRQGGRAVQGLPAAAAALREANAEVLLVNPERVEGETLWSSPSEPALVAVADADLRGQGIGDYREHRADEVIPLAAIAVGAAVHIEDKLPLADGVGVLLRHT